MEGFIKIRRGLRDHIRDGRMSLLQLGVFTHLLFCADFKTGIVMTSAPYIYWQTGQIYSVRQIQRALLALEEEGYIKRFHTQGQMGNYPVLINKYEVTDGDREGLFLNAKDTTDWQNPVYTDRATGVTDVGGSDGVSQGGDDGVSRGVSRGDAYKKSRNKSSKKSTKKSVEKCGEEASSRHTEISSDGTSETGLDETIEVEEL